MSTLVDELRRDYFAYTEPFPDRPPGMTGEDIPLYYLWRERPVPPPRFVFFNVKVGPPPADQLTGDPLQAALTAEFMAVHADAVVFDGTEWWILEYHRQASLPQYGRLLGYPRLFELTYPGFPRPRPLSLTYSVNPFLIPLFTEAQIPLLVYPEAKNPPQLLNPTAISKPLPGFTQPPLI